jgi:hypothetical protein
MQQKFNIHFFLLCIQFDAYCCKIENECTSGPKRNDAGLIETSLLLCSTFWICLGMNLHAIKFDACILLRFQRLAARGIALASVLRVLAEQPGVGALCCMQGDEAYHLSELKQCLLPDSHKWNVTRFLTTLFYACIISILVAIS